MEEVRQWCARYKGMLILLGVIGVMLAPLLWPFFLAIIFQGACVVAPILIVGAVVKKTRRERADEQKRNRKYPNEEKADFHASEAVSAGENEKGAAAQADSVPERSWETGKEQRKSLVKDWKTEKAQGENLIKGNHGMSDAFCLALIWYELEGRERIFRYRKKLEREGIHQFSISPEGICSVREENRYRRIGALRAYPGRETKLLIRELRKDHIRAAQKGKFLWLSWEIGRAHV